MKEDIKLLKEKFQEIKSLGLVKSLRKGNTGVGYTFEELLGKKEDQECKPDFKSIELKCKLGYSKSALTLFNCIPQRHNNSAIKYIFENYSQHRFNNKSDCKIFERKVFSNYAIERFGYEFKLKVDYYLTEVVMKAYYKGEFLEDVCGWDFKTLEKKLKKKLTIMAMITAYPYSKNNQIFYKYVKLDIYKLIGFFEFLQLIEKGKIFINFYMKSTLGKNGEIIIKDHGVGFRIDNNYIEELFYKLKH